MSSEPIRIIRGQGGQVEVDSGVVDGFALGVLKRAGFITQPTLRGTWIRLPFDMGTAWENEHASWAADMLTAARYLVDLDPSLRPVADNSAPPASAPRRTLPAMTAQPPPAPSRRR
ncbi:hypothetical protein OG607_41180 [Streptomyces sp. NBC_01537]|uniref:hypothetical protein n=1 Tax=Streptomyces sp. NBC_01537 TaxID=2903896 RepID=UPI0038638914